MFPHSRTSTRSVSRQTSALTILAIHAVVLFGWSLAFDKAHAAAMTLKSDTLSRPKISALSDHDVKFKTPTGVDANTDTITLTFPSGFTMTSIVFGDVDLEVDAACDGTYETAKTIAASAAASTWGAAVSGQVLTLTAPTNATAGEIAANSCVLVQIGTTATTGGTGTHQITNNSSAASYTLALGGTLGDSGNIVFNLITDDQVVVSAVVNETLSFSISSNTADFGTLSSGAAVYADASAGNATETEAHQIVAGTNASNGYVITVNGNTLTSGANTITAIGTTNTASSAGTEQFGMRMTASGGSGSVTAPYAASGFALDTAAFPDQVASSSGSSASTTYSVRYLANITAQTEAGAYTSTLTYIGTANF